MGWGHRQGTQAGSLAGLLLALLRLFRGAPPKLTAQVQGLRATSSAMSLLTAAIYYFTTCELVAVIQFADCQGQLERMVLRHWQRFCCTADTA